MRTEMSMIFGCERRVLARAGARRSRRRSASRRARPSGRRSRSSCRAPPRSRSLGVDDVHAEHADLALDRASRARSAASAASTSRSPSRRGSPSPRRGAPSCSTSRRTTWSPYVDVTPSTSITTSSSSSRPVEVTSRRGQRSGRTCTSVLPPAGSRSAPARSGAESRESRQRGRSRPKPTGGRGRGNRSGGPDRRTTRARQACRWPPGRHAGRPGDHAAEAPGPGSTFLVEAAAPVDPGGARGSAVSISTSAGEEARGRQILEQRREPRARAISSGPAPAGGDAPGGPRVEVAERVEGVGERRAATFVDEARPVGAPRPRRSRSGPRTVVTYRGRSIGFTRAVGSCRLGRGAPGSNPCLGPGTSDRRARDVGNSPHPLYSSMI